MTRTFMDSEGLRGEKRRIERGVNFKGRNSAQGKFTCPESCIHYLYNN